ncbi:hypothetical protein BH09BAC3_BH09BAC3_36710 [soil metagenome]
MARGFLITIVCFLIFSASHAQFAAGPLALVETEIRTDLAQHFNQPFPFRQWIDNSDTTDQWRQWALVENYTFGKNRGAIPMICDLQSLHPYFRDKVIELIRVCRAKGIELAVIETYRTRTKQNEYKAMGRRYTRVSAGSSKHQYGLAVDIVPVKDTVIQWNNIALWRKVGVQGEKLGLRWGGRWRRPFDPAHFEWTGGVPTSLLAKGTLPAAPKAQSYPCMEEDLNELKRHWKAWEIEQSLVANRERVRPTSSGMSLSSGGHD